MMVIQTLPIPGALETPVNMGADFAQAKAEGRGNGSAMRKTVDRPADIAAGQAARETIKRLQEGTGNGAPSKQSEGFGNGAPKGQPANAELDGWGII